MHRYICPPIPATFRKSVSTVRKDVRTSVKGGGVLTFPPHWSKIKAAFMQAQHGKCGFCEGRVLGLQYGDVEHYRPKGAVEVLDHASPATWGKEVPWSSTVKGRDTKSHSSTGYWWKAYSWGNYLVACQTCNQQWKKCLFPTADPLPRQLPSIQHRELALLLNPFGKIDPALHLAFGRMGEVTAYNGSVLGHATILTCGLDRPSLRQARYNLARATHERIDEISSDINNHDLYILLRGILTSGHADQSHCGMVRAIFRQRMEMSWDMLERLVIKLASAIALPPHRLCDC